MNLKFIPISYIKFINENVIETDLFCVLIVYIKILTACFCYSLKILNEKKTSFAPKPLKYEA